MLTPYYECDGITIYHGDSLEIMPQIKSESVDFVLTDPPYLVDFQSNRRKVLHDKIANDANDDWIGPAFKEISRLMKPNTLCVSFYGWPAVEKFVEAWSGGGLVRKSHIVFIKKNFGFGWFTRAQHEGAYLLTKGEPPRPDPGTAISDVIPWKGTGNVYHPTQKPVGVLYPLIESFSKAGDILIDPFMGSGTTLRAAKDSGRKAIGIEIDEKYCEIAATRLRQEVFDFGTPSTI